ncbi:MAG: citrate transporter [Cytophagales bacterium]|nr:citrate transporter [Cytophagales bacterium]
MKKLFTIFLSLFLFSGLAFAEGEHTEEHNEVPSTEVSVDSTHQDSTAHVDTHVAGHGDAHGDDHHGHLPAGWSVIPFVVLLLMIATGPLFFEHFWHHYYPVVAVVLASLVIGYYLYRGDSGSVIHSLAEYIQFIALLAGLFMASGGILINVDKKGKPMTNVVLLIIGAVLSNLIGTTGASMLLIRPFIRLNKGRVKPYHIMFFIFMVSNVGGSLTPIGDPPLFLGFLKGVPFAWTLTHNFVPWIFAIAILAVVFYIFDSKNTESTEEETEYSGKITIQGAKNFVWIAIVIAAVFIDPNVFDWVPGIKATIHGQELKFSFIRETLMLVVACLSYYFADKEALKGNEFEFEPIKEVAFIFIGIFFTMMPALQLVAAFASSPEGREMIGLHSLYWGTGALSGVLDNAPTYVNFLTAAISADGGSIANMSDVKDYAAGAGIFKDTESIVRLTAISVASVFFGAMTYIGNAPNFMVKSIAEQVGIKMPSFFEYIVKYSLVILLPILLVVWVVFFLLGAINLFV